MVKRCWYQHRHAQAASKPNRKEGLTIAKDPVQRKARLAIVPSANMKLCQSTKMCLARHP